MPLKYGDMRSFKCKKGFGTFDLPILGETPLPLRLPSDDENDVVTLAESKGCKLYAYGDGTVDLFIMDENDTDESPLLRWSKKGKWQHLMIGGACGEPEASGWKFLTWRRAFDSWLRYWGNLSSEEEACLKKTLNY